MEKNTKYPPGKNPKSLENLKKRPRVPNPNGRPRRELSITNKQREMLLLPCPYADKPGKTWLEWLADRGMALAGENPKYYCEIMNRLEGKVLQPIGGEDGPLILKILVASDHDKDNVERVIRGERT